MNYDALEEYLQENDINSKSIITEIEKSISSIVELNSSKSNETFNEEYHNGLPFLQVYPDYNLNSLPSWIIDEINTAKIIGKSHQTVIMKDGRKYQLNNTLNHLSGSEWTYFINSVINTSYKTYGEDSYAHNIRKIHPTPKPPQLMRDIVSFFTKENELVFDYFMGVGGSLLGAALCNRHAIGIDLNKAYIDAYQCAAKKLDLNIFPTLQADCLSVLNNKEQMSTLLNGEQISLVLIDPPYANMMSREKTGGDVKVYGNVATPFTNSSLDFGNLELSDFFDSLKKSVEYVLPYVKKRGYVVVFIKDLQPKDKEVNLLHSTIVNRLNEISNLNYKGLKIWADQTAKLFPYGYPFSFVANQIHQYILIFRKEKQ